MSECELWLTRRAAAGDERAFEVLLTANETKLRNVASTFVDSATEIDECYAIVTEKLWREILRGHFNPHRTEFVHYASTIAHSALKTAWVDHRRPKRWAEQAPTSLNGLVEAGWDQPSPSWSTVGANPLHIVLWRERLRECVEALGAAQLRAINVYLATDGVGASPGQVTAMYRARKLTAPLRLV